MSGYDAAQFGAADLAAVFPRYADYLLSTGLTLATVQAAVYTRVYRMLEPACDEWGYDPVDLQNPEDFVQVECAAALAHIFRANAIPGTDGGEAMLMMAREWESRLRDEWANTLMDFGTAVPTAAEDDDNLRVLPSMRFIRG